MPGKIEAREFRVEQFGRDALPDVVRKVFDVATGHIGLGRRGRDPMNEAQHLGSKLVQQQAGADVSVVRFLFDQGAGRHDAGERQFVERDAVIEIAAGLIQYGRGIDAVETGTGFLDDHGKPLVVERHPDAVGAALHAARARSR